jgi:hypothetical protein
MNLRHFAGPHTHKGPSVVMGVSVIAGDFVAGTQISAGIELDSPVGDADEYAGIAGMADELEGLRRRFRRIA